MNIFQKVTLKNLQKNRTRTLVTIVGIILSAAMFSATIISISSLRHWLIEASIYENGSWYGAFHDISWEDAKAWAPAATSGNLSLWSFWDMLF